MSDAPSSRLPNLYQLLALAGPEESRETIESAVSRALERAASVQATAASSPRAAAEAERLRKLAALAQKLLLDPERKASYDAQWRAVYQPSKPAAPAPAAAAPSASRASRFESLLPAGDPQAPFDMAAFLSSSQTRDPAAAEADLNKLIALLSGEQAASNLSTAAVDPANAVVEARLADPAADDGLPAGLKLSPGSGGESAAPAMVLAKRLQKKKQRALVLGGLGLAAGLVGLAVLGTMLLGEGTPSKSGTLAQGTAPKPGPVRGSGLPQVKLDGPGSSEAGQAAGGAAMESGLAQPPVGSGLPQPGQGDAQLSIDVAPDAPSAPQSMPSASPAAAPTTAPTAAPAAAEVAQAAAPTAGSAAASEPKPAAEPASESQQPAPVMADAKLSRQDKQAWQAGMNEAKKLIGEHDFKGAEQKLAQLRQMAKTAVQREQLSRIEQIGGLVKEARQAISDAITGMAAAETVKIGTSTVASFIEGDQSKITIRVSGERRSYAIEEMPVPLGLALMDLKLDMAQATTLARKGAYIVMYCATHPSNKTMLPRGKQMLDDAAAAGAITPELAKFYEDDTSLAAVGN